MIKLNIGCINWKPGGYTHVDIHNHKISKLGAPDFIDLDIVADARSLPFDNNTIEEIFSDRMIEHVPLCDREKMFCEFYRVLVPGGKLDISAPDLKLLCFNFLKCETLEQKSLLLRQFYGSQDRSLGDFDYHKSGYDEEILTNILRKTGFVGMKRDNTGGGRFGGDMFSVGLRIICFKGEKND